MKRAAFEKDFLGKGLAAPIQRRGSSDFTVSRGAKLVSMSIRQILNTDKGELPWNPNFGTSIRKQKNKLLNEDFRALAQTEIATAIREFEPRVEVISVDVQTKGTRATITVKWQIIERNVPGNQVLVGPASVEVTV